MVNISPTYIIDSLEDKSMLFTQGKKIENGLYLYQVENMLALHPPLFCKQIDKKIPLSKTNY